MKGQNGMVIGICDDDLRDRERVQSICSQVIGENLLEAEIVLFKDGEEFLKSDCEIDLLILDIEMPKFNGIEVKTRLQQMEKSPLIIFASDHDELVWSAFGINVFGFVIKNTLEKQLPKMLKSALAVLGHNKMIEDRIDSRDVIYIKSEHVYAKLYMIDDKEELIRTSLNELEDLLEDVGFIRTHRAYLVNCKWICKVRDNEVELEQGKIPVSVRLRGEVKRKYNEYCEKNARYC